MKLKKKREGVLLNYRGLLIWNHIKLLLFFSTRTQKKETVWIICKIKYTRFQSQQCFDTTLNVIITFFLCVCVCEISNNIKFYAFYFLKFIFIHAKIIQKNENILLILIFSALYIWMFLDYWKVLINLKYFSHFCSLSLFFSSLYRNVFMQINSYALIA